MINAFSFFLVLFPGVPIFFFISGYLISQSYEYSRTLKSYSMKRILRIYPALVASVFVGALLILINGYESQHSEGLWDWLILIVTKSTVLQFYNPEFLRGYGDGVFNGNLWTITVELQFYALIVILSLIQQRLTLPKATFWLAVLIITLIFNRLYIWWLPHYREAIWFKLYGVSFAPWFYMFALGVIAQHYQQLLIPMVKKYASLIIGLYLLLGFGALHFKLLEFGNHISPLLVPLLFLTILSLAYCFPFLANKLVKGQDISYGIYLYHMLIINFFLHRYTDNAAQHTLMMVAMVIALSTLSWFTIEKHALKLKKHFAAA